MTKKSALVILDSADAQRVTSEFSNRIDGCCMALLPRWGGWAAVLLIAVLSLVPAHLRPHLLAIGQLEHFAAYGLVGALLVAAYCTRWHLIVIAVSLPICAATLEVLQNFTPGRVPKFSDFVAGAVGTWAGVALVVLLRNLASVAPRTWSEKLTTDDDVSTLADEPEVSVARTLS